MLLMIMCQGTQMMKMKALKRPRQGRTSLQAVSHVPSAEGRASPCCWLGSVQRHR